MFRYGMTQWIAGEEPLEDSFRRLSACGYDSIELAGEPDRLDAAECRRLMEAYGLKADSMCGIFGEGRDLSGAGETGEAAVRYVKKCVDFGAELGTRVLIAVPSPVGRLSPPKGVPEEKLWDNAVRNLRAAGDYAAGKGLSIAIEAINRYETFFVNTIEKACRLADDACHSAVGVMADTFHMNLEEADMAASLRLAGDRLLHVHLADNTREPPGMGATDFRKVLRTLQDIRYRGILCMEFLPRVSDPYASMRGEGQAARMDRYARSALEHMKGVEKALADGK